jgi:hypothetical protein
VLHFAAPLGNRDATEDKLASGYNRFADSKYCVRRNKKPARRRSQGRPVDRRTLLNR